MARIGYTGGLSRQPVKMDTGAVNFMAGMAQVQAMQQAQEAHEQQLQQNEVKMTLAQADNERADRAMKIKEQEAYQKSVAFDTAVRQGDARVATWNGKDRPSWGSSQLGGQWDQLNTLNQRIREGRRSGRDVTADVLAFQNLTGEYDALYQSESGQRVLTNQVAQLETIYGKTGLTPDPEVEGLLSMVGGQVGGTGMTMANLDAADRSKVAKELARAAQFEEEFDVRLMLKSDIDSMREFLVALRGGQIPQGLQISEEVLTNMRKLRLSPTQGQFGEDSNGYAASQTLTELADLLSRTSDSRLDAWDPDQDIGQLQDAIAKAKGLFHMLGSSDAVKLNDQNKTLIERMELERTQFAERNAVAEQIIEARRESPEGPLSPYEQWALRHKQNVRANKFSLTYDDDAEYLSMWTEIQQRAKAAGGDVVTALNQLNSDWRTAQTAREEFAAMKKPTLGQRQKGSKESKQYFEAMVGDILAHEQQLGDDYVSSEHPNLDRVVNADFSNVAARVGREGFGLPREVYQERMSKNQRVLRDSDVVVDGDQNTAILIAALKEANVPVADFFGLEDVGTVTADEAVGMSNALLGPAAGLGAVLQAGRYEGNVRFAPTNRSFQDFARKDPKGAARLLTALARSTASRVEAKADQPSFNEWLKAQSETTSSIGTRERKGPRAGRVYVESAGRYMPVSEARGLYNKEFGDQ